MSAVLTIGMATHKEPDLLWATLEALHTYHPRVSYLVVDNSPERDVRSEAVTTAVGGRYLHRPDLTGTSKPRDAVFRFAKTPWVMCIDAHVLLEPGAVQAALDFIARNPESSDLVSGPIVWDNGATGAHYWRQEEKYAPGLWGVWAADEKGEAGGVPFEIPMMGLGLFVMRREAWPGFHPLFNGFGGEEGYVHELVRQRGGKALCVPGVRWRHKFRDVGGWDKNPPPPYPLRAEDHTWNLLVGHREVGVRADDQIRRHFVPGWSDQQWGDMVRAADGVQPFAGPRPEVPRQKLLALWYTDNTAPAPLLQRSAMTVAHAADQTLRHDVTVSACGWSEIPGVKFGHRWTLFDGPKERSLATIVAQITAALRAATQDGQPFDAVVMCEHDVLYPANHFDRIGDVFAANVNVPIVSNMNYIGLNATGWQTVKERQEPMHQLAFRTDAFTRNLDRLDRLIEAKKEQVSIEPYETGDWASRAVLSLPDPTGMKPGTMPSVHVNRKGSFTNHGEVVYHPTGVALWHPHWGDAKRWWPGEVKQSANPFDKGGCVPCQADKFAAKPISFLAKAARDLPSDFNEHAPTLTELARSCSSAAELSLWYKVADVAIVHGLPKTGTFTSVSPGAKPSWPHLKTAMGDRFQGRAADPHAAELPAVDLLFIDTHHTAEALFPLMERHAANVGKYLVVHCTEKFGESGDKPNAPGVLHALRTFCHRHPEWVVKRRDRNNHGLMVLSKCAEDVKEKPSLWRQGMNYTAAMAKHVAGGRKTVPLEVLEARQAECAICEERALDACAACGCPLEAKLPLATEQCGLVKKGQPPKWDRYEGGATGG